ncbi:hypothetical protein SDC9_187895 [bioreactor metagenome]|uniref:Uncharacterized protein n=1 Tax=bioreactor metagenome TaxID=1076179 RepID=A0A645HQ48_9ZZZZ
MVVDDLDAIDFHQRCGLGGSGNCVRDIGHAVTW